MILAFLTVAILGVYILLYFTDRIFKFDLIKSVFCKLWPTLFFFLTTMNFSELNNPPLKSPLQLILFLKSKLYFDFVFNFTLFLFRENSESCESF